MGLLWLGGIRLLLLLLLLLLGVLGGAAREPHSLRYFHTMVSDPGPGLPQFVAVGSVDGEVFVRYDSETRKTEPQVGWIAANTDQQYWDRETETLQRNEQFFRMGLDTLQERYNQSIGESGLGHSSAGCGSGSPGCKQEQGQCRELSLALAATPFPRTPRGSSVRDGGRKDPDLVLPCSRLLPTTHLHQLAEGWRGPGAGDPEGEHRAQQ
uniref:MHC class I-like antigen recognition-like domain-containing protein n=1 Tax=Anas zonorhyncha TaxID=75864 RepID=A0A8B9UL89_9AVES